jgi:hypothetical protein
MMLLAVLFVVAIENRTALLAGGAAAAGLTIIISGSRAALIAALVALAVQALARRKELGRWAAGSVGLLLVAAVSVPEFRDRIGNSHTVHGRWLLRQESAHVGLHRWWSGGPSTFVDSIGRYHDSAWVRDVGVKNPPDSPHSWPLQAFVAGGIPLLVIALALAALLAARGWAAVNAQADPLVLGCFGAMVGYGVGILPNFTIAGSTCLAAFLVGCLVGEPAARTEPLAPVRVVAGLALAGTVAFSAGAVAERLLQEGVDAALRGHTTEAVRDFDHARALRPLDGDVAMLASQALAAATNAGDTSAAGPTEMWARRSLARTPNTYASGLALAVAEISRNDVTAALPLLDHLVRLFPTEPEARIQRGIVRFGNHDLPGAMSDLRLAEKLDPNDRTAREVIARIGQQTGGTGS